MGFDLAFQALVCFSHLLGPATSQREQHDHNLVCLNDYYSTIRCELNLTYEQHHHQHDALYWLEFYDDSTPFVCVLKSHTDYWACAVKVNTSTNGVLSDVDQFRITLNYSYHGNNGSKPLQDAYKPFKNIQPIPPSNLTLLWKPDAAVFHWCSSYSSRTVFQSYLKYQLRIQRKDQVVDVDCAESNVSVPASTFAHGADYTALVRSLPGKRHYNGVWSHWGPAVYWTTRPSDKSETPHMNFWMIFFALLVLPLIWFCHFLYTRLKKCNRHPGPAPHIGEFKCSAMLPEKVGELLHREESLQIDSLTEEPSSTRNETTSRGEDGPGSTSLPEGSKVSISSWMQIVISAEKGSATYSNDYCTLSDTVNEQVLNMHGS